LVLENLFGVNPFLAELEGNLDTEYHKLFRDLRTYFQFESKKLKVLL
ncbi:16352_t:CDS:1, partial [Funneliformis geosporum]